jgi:hypothetical protein
MNPRNDIQKEEISMMKESVINTIEVSNFEIINNTHEYEEDSSPHVTLIPEHSIINEEPQNEDTVTQANNNKKQNEKPKPG